MKRIFHLLILMVFLSPGLHAQVLHFPTTLQGNVEFKFTGKKSYDSVLLHINSKNPSGRYTDTPIKKYWVKSNDTLSRSLSFEFAQYGYHTVVSIIRFLDKRSDSMFLHADMGNGYQHHNDPFKMVTPFTPGHFVIKQSMFRYNNKQELIFYLSDINLAHQRYTPEGNLIHKNYYDWNNGMLHEEGVLDTAAQRIGKWSVYWNNGQLKSTAEYVNGQLHGTMKYYDTTGRVTATSRFVDGREESRVVE